MKNYIKLFTQYLCWYLLFGVAIFVYEFFKGEWCNPRITGTGLVCHKYFFSEIYFYYPFVPIFFIFIFLINIIILLIFNKEKSNRENINNKMKLQWFEKINWYIYIIIFIIFIFIFWAINS